jgi:hypothetical protein
MLTYSFHNELQSEVVDSKDHDLYKYRVYIGENNIGTVDYNSYWFLENDTAVSFTGNGTVITSKKLCVEIFGYTPETRSSTFSRYTDLPYINGCSTKQLIDPVRAGDPTWQMLYIPPYTAEQAHHVHSTTRVVYVASGCGFSHVGTESNLKTYDLTPGTVVVLDKMIPHHFSTNDSHLVVLPIHIFSSTSNEHHHPMFNGTFKT